MTKLPTSIKIAGHKIDIIKDDSLAYDRTFGASDVITSAIGINPRVSETQQRATLLHEALHHMYSVYGVGQYVMQELGSRKQSLSIEETVVRAFEIGLMDLINNDKRFIKYLVNKS